MLSWRSPLSFAKRKLPVTIDVYGQRVLSQSTGTLLSRFTELGIDYKGPYSGGLVSLPTNEYHAMLAHLGVGGDAARRRAVDDARAACISTAVGGIPTLVDHGTHGNARLGTG